MKEIAVGEVKNGTWVDFENEIVVKIPSYVSDKEIVCLYAMRRDKRYHISKDTKVNLEWWDVFAGKDGAYRWIIMKAYQDGAKIEFKSNNILAESTWEEVTTPVWDWSESLYRVKKSTHKIIIDDKEIELSSESYNNLKESLKE